MITKEAAKQIYNLHSQIEKNNEIIEILKKCENQYEKDNEGIDMIRDNWGNCQTVTISIPDKFIKSDSSTYLPGSATIYQISVPDTILVLESHVVRLKKALAEEERKIMEI